MKQSYIQIKYACWLSNMSQAVVTNILPLLFIPFKELYGISYTLLGSLVLVNFITQLTVDVVFSVFSHKFNITRTVQFTPLVTLAGMFFFALTPFIFPRNAIYTGLVIATMLMAASGGLVEVLISPTVAAIPAENPEREMSFLHSVYAWGVIVVVIVSTLFLWIFGRQMWQWLFLLWGIFPLLAAILFWKNIMPPMHAGEHGQSVVSLLKKPYLLLCIICIFVGGAAECGMAQWSSGYLERSVQISKVWGDILGVAMFGFALGMGRTLYGKYGRRLYPILFFGGIASTVCYLIVTFVNIPAVTIIACAVTGFCVSMMWPGTLIAASDHFPAAGVMMFAMLAAGGDLGAAAGPWLIGRVTDIAIENPYIINLAQDLNLTAEQIGLKCGMLAGTLFPFLAVIMFGALWYLNRAKNRPGVQ